MRLSIGLVGPIAAIYAWLIIITCIFLNPWFVFTRDAFSDLGSSSANMPWLYNYGMISIGILIILYSSYLVYVSRNKLMVVGSSFGIVSGIFLMFVGLFPAGTRPHVFVSTWFFVQFDMCIIVWSLGAYLNRGGSMLPLSSLILGIVSIPIGFLVPWPSAATVEAYGVLVIDYWVFVSYYITR